MNIKIDNMGGYVTDEVSTVTASRANSTSESRIKFVTDLAAVSRGNSESKNPRARFKALLKEAAPSLEDAITKMYDDINDDIRRPSRPLEFLPVVIKYAELGGKYILLSTKGDLVKVPNGLLSEDEFFNNIVRYSYIKDKIIYTNARALLNTGVKIEDIPYNNEDELSEFKVIKIKVPMFVWAQLMTHTAFSKESQSDRISTTNDYWLPEDFRSRLFDYTENENGRHNYIVKSLLSYNNIDMLIDELLNLSSTEVTDLFKALGYKKEIYQRAMYYFKYKVMIMTGWANDPSTFTHLFLERNAKSDLYSNWTQRETAIAVNAIRMIIEGYGNIVLDSKEEPVTSSNDVNSVVSFDNAPTEINMFQSSDVEAYDYFGSSVALSADGLVALVGSRFEDTTASAVGKVYTFKRATIDSDWTEVNMFQSSDIEAGDWFGRSVALSGDGLVALVGADGEDTTASTAGKVYTFKRATIDSDWVEVNMFQSSDIEAYDLFGRSVALSADGLVALVGAYGEDTTATNAGKVYTYKRSTIDSDWIEVNMFQSSDVQVGDYFGVSVALSADGLVALVGAIFADTTGTDAGKVHTFKRATIDSDWTEVNMFQSSDIEIYDYFGSSVALSADGLVALVGAFGEDTTATDAGKIYIYKRATIDSDWTEVNMFQSSDIEDYDSFGTSVALSADGVVALVGAYGKDTTATNAGKVYTYKFNKDLNSICSDSDVLSIAKVVNFDIAPTEINMFQSNDIEASDNFGVSVALSADGLVALVGAYGKDTTAACTGKVYTYKRVTIYDPWVEMNSFQSSDIEAYDGFGESVALSADGLVALVGSEREDTTGNNAGKVYTYKRATIDDPWTEINMFQSSDIEAGDGFGYSVALSADGLVALVGSRYKDTTATDAGKVYTYKRATIDDQWTEVNMLQCSDIEAYDAFGVSVALSADGLVALVGSAFEDTTSTSAGKVYTYKRSTINSDWIEINSFQSSDIEANDYFGISIALSGDGLVALVGAYGEDTTATDAGKVYTYKRATIDDTWTEVSMFQGSDIEAYDYFGASVALSTDGSVALVGAHYKDATDSSAGVVYTFKFNQIN